ncbi:HAD-IA family hydrolase [Mesorhizobium sp. ArgA1]
MMTADLSKFHHIAFDLDGVLVDSQAVVELALRRWAQERGYSPDLIIELSAGRRDQELVAEVAPHRDPEAEAKCIADFEIEVMSQLRAIDGAEQFFRSIPSARRSIVTSSTKEAATARLRQVGIPLPKVLISADDVRRGKPDPQPYELLLEKVGVLAEECLVFEDSPAGIAAALAAGCGCIGVGAAAQNCQGIMEWIPDFGQGSNLAAVNSLRGV